MARQYLGGHAASRERYTTVSCSMCSKVVHRNIRVAERPGFKCVKCKANIRHTLKKLASVQRKLEKQAARKVK